MTFINDKSGNPWKTVDYDRGIILINKGRLSGDEPEVFFLDIGETHIEFWVRTIAIVGENKKFDVSYEIERINLPMELKPKESQIKIIIEDALQAYGLSHSKEKTNFVSVNFSPSI